MSPSGVSSSCGKNWLSKTANYLCWFCGLGWKLGNSEVSGMCGFTVHKLIIANHSASDTCASVIKSSLSVSWIDFVWVSLYSNSSWSYRSSSQQGSGRIGSQRSMSRKQQLPEGSNLSVKIFFVVVFICWKWSMDHAQIIISLNIGCFHLLLPEKWWNSGVQFFMRVVYYDVWVRYNILSQRCLICSLESWLF